MVIIFVHTYGYLLDMYMESDKQLIKKYLERNYPIQRVKTNKGFKRAIHLETGHTYFLGQVETHNQLRHELATILILIFSFQVWFIHSVLDEFLPLKIRA